MARPADVLILGAGLAGAHAAMTLRNEGFDGPITLVGDEPDLPYDRTPVSKQYLLGEQPLEAMRVFAPEAYEERAITLHLGTPVASVEPRDRAVVLADGRRLRADAIVIATGSRNRQLAVPGAHLPWVLSLRTRADADRLREQLAGARRAAVVGMGFVGCEVAAALRGRGIDVVAIDPLAAPLERVLGRLVGGAVASLHAEQGVTLALEKGVARFDEDGAGRRVVLSDDSEVECDVAVVGVGAQPNVEFVAGTGIEVANGIVVDEWCRTTVDGIYAAGDVTAHYHPLFGTRLRVEHWRNAIQQGAAVARSILGTGAPYQDLHWFWSDQYGANLQYQGHHEQVDEIVVRGALEERRFVAFYVEGGVPRAAAAMNMGAELRRARDLLLSPRAVDPAALRDLSVDLRRL